jgi:CRISPR-associated protein Csb2
MTTLAIQYLCTPCLANASDRYSPEWPPSPDRVFQALVATACELGLDRQPLQEIERIRPALTCPEALPIASAKVFVPSNQTPEQKNAAASRPYMRAGEGVILYYHYPDLSPSAAAWLRQAARNLTHIGRSQGFVVADALRDDEAPEPLWEPHDIGEVLFSTSYPGRLLDLDRAYSAGQRPQRAPMTPYRMRRNKYPSSCWRDLLVLKPGRRLYVTRAAQVAEAVRSAILSVLGDDAPAWAHGHGSGNSHMAITPLPNVGHAHADGMMTGIGIWLPGDLERKERAAMAYRIAVIRKIQSGGMEFPVSIQKMDQFATRPETWTRLSRTWASVTPVVLDRHPKKGKLTAEQIIAESCVHAGLPEPVGVRVAKESGVRGVPSSREFRLRRQGSQYYHAELEFAQPVWGPVLVGRERFYGLGMFKPL